MFSERHWFNFGSIGIQSKNTHTWRGWLKLNNEAVHFKNHINTLSQIVHYFHGFLEKTQSSFRFHCSLTYTTNELSQSQYIKRQLDNENIFTSNSKQDTRLKFNLPAQVLCLMVKRMSHHRHMLCWQEECKYSFQRLDKIDNTHH